MLNLLRLLSRAAVASLLLAASTAVAAGPARAADPVPRLVPSDRLMWVPGVLAGKLHGVDPRTGKTERTLPGNTNPMIAAPSADGNTLYVVNLPKVGKVSGISVVDVPSGKSEFIRFPGIAAAEVLDNGGRYLYGVDIVFHNVVKIDTRTKKIVKTFSFPDHGVDEPLGIEISPDNKTLYIAWLGGWLQAYDTTTGKTVKEIKLPKVDNAIKLGAFGQLTLPGWLVLSPDGKRLYSLNFATGDTNVWDTETWQDVGKIEHGGFTLTILASFSPDGKRIYFTNFATRELHVVDTQTLQTVAKVKLSGRPISVATQDDGTVLVSVINSFYNNIDPVSPIAAVVLVGGLTPFANVNLGDGRIARYSGADLRLLSSTAVKDTVPGAFVAPPPAATP